MEKIIPLYALLVVAIMKLTAATTTAEGTTKVTIMVTATVTGPMTETATCPTLELMDGFTTEPPTEPPRVGPVPEPILPDLDGDANKTFQFEFAVEEATPEGCKSDDLNSTAREIFKNNVAQELEAVYEESPAFLSVEVVLILRNGSLIVSHGVTYSYNNMTDEERMASAQEIYDETLGLAVAGGKLGYYPVQEDCGNCAFPKETSDICSQTVTCQPEYSKPAFKTNYWVCESICFSDRDYCNGHGFCSQRGNLYTQPICSCDWDSARGEWYWGYRCPHYASQIKMYIIVGCSLVGVSLLVLLVSIVYCICRLRNQKPESDRDSQSSESVINAFQNFGYDHTAETVVFPPFDDNNIDDGDILQQSRPYSYIYSKGEGNSNVGSSSFIGNQNGGAQRGSELEVKEDAVKRQSNGSADNRHSSLMKPNGSSQQKNPDFWGNLNEPSAEHIMLEPFLARYDDNDSIKIQRPRISAHYDYSCI